MTPIPTYKDSFYRGNKAFPIYLTIHHIEKNFPVHRHDFLEFSLVIEGHGWEVIDGVVHRLQPGIFTFLLPYQVHEIRTEPGVPLQLYNCNFDMDLLYDTHFDSGFFKMLRGDHSYLPPIVQFNEEEAKWLEETLREMRIEYKGSNIWRNALLRSKLTEILIRFDRNRRLSSSTGHGGAIIHGDNGIWQIIRYIHANYREEITLSKLAQRFHISSPTLSKMFKKQLGLNYLDFLHEVRIRHACSLLHSTEMSISQISYEVGCGSYQTFSRIFFQLKRMTPSEYRKIKGKIHFTADNP